MSLALGIAVGLGAAAAIVYAAFVIGASALAARRPRRR